MLLASTVTCVPTVEQTTENQMRQEITVKFIRLTVLPVFKWSHLDQGTSDGKQKNMYENSFNIYLPSIKNSKLTPFLSLRVQFG